jgi:hypothetical protein
MDALPRCMSEHLCTPSSLRDDGGLEAGFVSNAEIRDRWSRQGDQDIGSKSPQCIEVSDTLIGVIGESNP